MMNIYCFLFLLRKGAKQTNKIYSEISNQISLFILNNLLIARKKTYKFNTNFKSGAWRFNKK